MSSGRPNRLVAWLDDRTGAPSAFRALMNEPVPGGARWGHALGGVLLFLLVLEAVTGIFLSFYYAPSAQTAWASVAFIEDELTLGWLVRGLHSFGSVAMVLVAGLHMLWVIWIGAYKAPRETNWILGLVLFGIVVVFAITGYGLPWDQKGYWAKLVETSIMGTSPVIGPVLEKLAQGGGSYGNYTVTHFYALHVLVLPALTLLLVAFHLVLARRHKATPHWSLSPAEVQARTEPYWPGQAFRDVFLSAVALAIVVVFVAKMGGAELEAPADPTSNYNARPEWYARPLYHLRMLFEGPLELLATMVIPGIVLALVAALPLLDRTPSRDPRRRLKVLGATGLGVFATVAAGFLSVRKDANDPEYQKDRVAIHEQAQFARQLARKGVLPEGGTAVFRNDPQFEARELWRQECASCHSLNGQGGADGPDLYDYNSRAWILGFLKDPQGHLYMGPAKKEKGMKPVNGTDHELAVLTEFVYAQTGATDVNVDMAKEGETLFSDKNCDACHELDGTTDAKGPNLLARGTFDYVEKVIAEPDRPELYGERAKMPNFAGKLTPAQLRALTEFVLKQRKS